MPPKLQTKKRPTQSADQGQAGRYLDPKRRKHENEHGDENVEVQEMLIENEGLALESPPPQPGPSANTVTIPEKLPALLDGEFFKVVISNNELQYVCQLCRGGRKLSGNYKSTGNFFKHVQRVHPSYEKKASEKRDLARQSESQTPSPKTKPDPLLNFVKSARSICVTQEEATNSIVDFVVEGMLPLRTVNKPEFKNMVACLSKGNPTKIKAPGKHSFREILKRRKQTMIFNIKERLKAQDYVCTTADLWSQNHRAFLGVTAHFLDATTLERESVILACRRMKFQHTAEKVGEMLYSVHDEFNIVSKTTHTVTDNASNFGKAFRLYHPLPPDVPTFLSTLVTSANNSDADVDLIMNGTGINDSANDDEDSDSDVEIHEVVLKDDVESSVRLPKQLRCAAHSLRLVAVTDCAPEKIRGAGADIYRDKYRKVFPKLSAFWNRCSRSTLAGDFAELIAGGKFPYPNDTRWNAVFDAILFILKTDRTNLDKLFEKLKLTQLSETDIQFLKEYVEVNEPLALALDILQGEKTCYLGNLLPSLLVIIKRVGNLKDLEYCAPLQTTLIEALKQRFRAQLNLGNEESEAFVLASLSHPRFKLHWVPKENVEKCRTLFLDEVEKLSVSSDKKRNVASDSSDLPHDEKDFYSVLDSGDNTADSFNRPPHNNAKLEALQYLESPTSVSLQHLDRFPNVKTLFLKHNTPLPSSGPIERSFSSGGQILVPRRNRLSDENFEMMLLLKGNKGYSK